MDEKERLTVTSQNGNNEKNSVKDVNISLKFNKRKGTSDMMIDSDFKTNLVTLMLCRTLVDERIDFVLGCNVDGIGKMSEICYRYNADNNKKPVVVFIKTKHTGAITDKDWNSANNDFSLHECFRNFLLIIDRFNKDCTDPLFKGNIADVEPYLIIYTPNSCKIKSRKAVSLSDKIITNRLNSIIGGSEINKIFKIDHETSIDDIIHEKIEHIGKIILAYAASDDVGDKNTHENMLNVIDEYRNFLIPNVIKINEQNGNWCGEFSDALFESNNQYYIRLKKVLFNKMLKNSMVSNYENSRNHISLLLQRGDIATLIANGLTIDDSNDPVIYELFWFHKLTKKLVLKPGLPPEITQEELVKSILNIKMTEAIMDEALEIAGKKTLTTIKIVITSKIKEFYTKLATDQRSSGSYFENDKQLATRFINSLYIYSEQCEKLERLIKKEIGEDQVLRTTGSILEYHQPESVYLQLHSYIQKWWLLQAEPYYLTNNNCNFIKQHTVIELPYLSILNLRCMNEVKRYCLKFKTTSLELFDNISNLNCSVTNVISNDVLLSSIRLAQYFDQTDRSSLFIDLEHVSSMKENEFKMLSAELNTANTDTFVVIIMHKDVNNELNWIQEIVKVSMLNLVIISKSAFTFADTIQLKDDNTSLADIDNDDDILKYKITVQGHEDKLENFIDGDMKHIVNAGILSKIIKQEKIEVGRNLTDSTYEKLKDYFVERKIRNDATSTVVSELELSVLLDIQEPVVTMIAAPGMGKSKLLTHLSIKTKHKFPYMWIIRMNLLDYSKEFNNWYKCKTIIGLQESMKLVCKAEIGSDFKYCIELIDGVLILNNKELEGAELMHLELIIASFNEGHICFIFDGFDEICPHYAKVVIQFMKCFADYCIMPIPNNNSPAESCSLKNNLSKRNNRHRIWITSRPYNIIKRTLVNNFAQPFYLQHLDKHQQTHFYHKYWQDHLKIEKLSKKQFENVDAFFKFMNQYRQSAGMQSKSPATSAVPLRLMHEAAVDYFRNEITSDSTDINKDVLKRWISKDELQTLDNCSFRNGRRHYLNGLELAGTPLHMQIYADLFVSEILGTSASRNWEPDVHTFEFYERFLETKLKKIRFEEKGGEDINSATSQIFYDEEKKNFTEKHKWLAFHALIHRIPHYLQLIPPQKRTEIDNWVHAMRKGEEKTGLIYCIQESKPGGPIVGGGFPRFVHLVFAEYFSVECIADLLKNSSILQMHMLINFVITILLRTSESLMTVFDYKLKSDEKLREALTKKKNQKFIFSAMMRQRKQLTETYSFVQSNLIGPLEKGAEYLEETTLVKLLINGSIHTAKLLLQSVEGNLNSFNVKIFVHYIGRDFFVLAIKYDDLIEYVLNSIREVDPSMIREVLDQCGLSELSESMNNTEILKHMREKFTSIDFP